VRWGSGIGDGSILLKARALYNGSGDEAAPINITENNQCRQNKDTLILPNFNNLSLCQNNQTFAEKHINVKF
jgi:hypothetical protein